MFEGVARFSYRFRWAVLVVTALLVPIGAIVGQGVFEVLKPGGYDDTSTESFKAREIALEAFGTGSADLVVLYTRTDDQPILNPETGEPDPESAAAITAALERGAADESFVSSISFFSTGSAQFVSEDGTHTFAVVSLSGDEQEKFDAVERLEPLFEAESENLATEFGGEIPAALGINETLESDLQRAELITFPITAILLVIIFRTLVAAAIPLILGGLAIVFALAMLRLIASVTEVSAFALNVVTVLGLGMAIDYSLFILNRYREEVQTKSIEEAIVTTVSTTGKAVAFSGVTLATSLIGLFFFPQVFLRSMAIGGIAVAALALFIAITVLPALIGVLGDKLERLRVPGLKEEREDETGKGGFWHSLALQVMRRPGLIAIGVVGFLLLLGSPFLNFRASTQDVRALDEGFEARRVIDVLNTEFTPHETTPVYAIVETEDDPLNPETVGELFDYGEALAATEGVARVDSIFSLAPGRTREEYQQIFGGGIDAVPPELAAGLPLFVNGNLVRFSNISEYEIDSDDGQSQISDVRDVPEPAGSEVLVGGNAADLFDTKRSIVSRLPLMLAVIAVATFVALFLVFGSITLPLKAMLMNAFSLTAAFGAMVFIFQDGRLEGVLQYDSLGTIDVTLPILMFAILFGLSMDYEVLMLSRVREEYVRTGDNTLAVARGLEKTGRLITSAAAILIVVIAAFATSSLTIMKTLGVGMALAIAIDATIVRALLVPASMRLMGNWNWWAPAPLVKVWEAAGLGDLEGTGASSTPVHASMVVKAYRPAAATAAAAPPVPPPAPAGGLDEAATIVQPSLAATQAFLVQEEGNAPGTQYPLSAGVTRIGRRSDNDIAVADALVSGHHARIEWSGDGTCTLIDDGSTNGTFVDGERVTGPVEIPAGAAVRVGNSIFKLHLVVPEPAPPPPVPPAAAPEPEPVVTGAPEAAPGALHEEVAEQVISSVPETTITPSLRASYDYLIVKEGANPGAVHQLAPETTAIGRDPRNELVLDDPQVSGFHAHVQRGLDGGLIIEDRGSTNGTAVNGERLTDIHRLLENDQIRLGSTVLQFKRVS